ncbi:MAG: WhiB family transcriptional regulator, partial [Nocardioides sp.]|nr:WhiB family transcriptional regulator [Nocardioides sp.]
MTVTQIRPDASVGRPQNGLLPAHLEQALELLPEDNLAPLPQLPVDALAWQNGDAACLSQCVESFFGGADVGEADPDVRRVCATCPLQTACMSHALAYEQWGLWALTESER